MKSSSRIMWAALTANNRLLAPKEEPVLCKTRREAELKSPVGQAQKVLVTITPT